MYPLCYCGLLLDTADCIVVDGLICSKGDGHEFHFYFFWGGGLESLLEEQSHSNQMVVTSRIGEFFLEAFFKYKSNVVTDAGL